MRYISGERNKGGRMVDSEKDVKLLKLDPGTLIGRVEMAQFVAFIGRLSDKKEQDATGRRES